MGALQQRLGLGAHRHPANDEGAADAERGSEGPELLDDLDGELPGGGDDEGEDAEGVLREAVEDGEGEGGGLSAAGLGEAEDVVAGEDAGDAVGLDGGRRADAELGAHGDGPVGEAEGGEGRGVGRAGVVIGVGVGFFFGDWRRFCGKGFSANGFVRE